ncbi:hypothetical protein FRC00_010006 [Tulasnella sp. 408]|nr:hypothetical protein FRC00_010006 [Tulasnella sp. 408]
MFAAEMEEGERVLSLNGLHELRQMYDSKGEHARVFTFFAGAFDPMTGPLSFTDQVQALRDLAQRAQLREEYSETIADYDVIWKLYEWNDKQDTDGLAPPLVDPG